MNLDFVKSQREFMNAPIGKIGLRVMHNDAASRRMHAGNGAFVRHFLSSRSIRIGRRIIIYLVSVSSLCGDIKARSIRSFLIVLKCPSALFLAVASAASAYPLPVVSYIASR